MGRNRLNFFLDLAISLIAFCLVTTGLILRYVLPPGTGGRLLVLGWGRHDWGEIHFWLAAVIGLLLLAHLALHWSWVCSILGRMIHSANGSSTSSPGRARIVYGCVALVLVAALAFGLVWLARSSVVEGGGGGKDWRGGREGAGRKTAGTTEEQAKGRWDSRESGEAANASVGGRDPSGDRPEPPMDDCEKGRGGGDSFVRGSMTLQEVAERAKLSVDHLRTRLGFPTNTPADEQIGRMARRHGLDMSAVRKALSANPGREEVRSAAGTDTPPPNSPRGAASSPGASR